MLFSAIENDVALRLTDLIVLSLLIPAFDHDLNEGGKGDKAANGKEKGKGSTPVERRLEQG